VEVSFQIVGEEPPLLEISVNDDGPGIPSEVMENMGEPFITRHKESMGLGIFLANAAIQHLGGKIEMFNLKVGGALTLIKLPLPDYQQA
jgi:two-component system sensor histidine kinase RegB